MGRRRTPTGEAARTMSSNAATVERARASPEKLRRRISMGEPASSGMAQPRPPLAVNLSASMPAIGLSPIRGSPPRRRRSSGASSPSKHARGCSVMLQQSTGDVRRVRLPRRGFAELVAAAVKEGELPRFYAIDATGERRRLQTDDDLAEAVEGAKGCAPLVYVKSEPYPDYARTTANLRPPSNWDSAVYPGSPLSKLADQDPTVDRLRRPKPTNPYYDGIVGPLQENTAARPFLNDPDPDHPAFTTSRLRRSPVLCAKQKRGIDTPLPYTLPSFGPAGGMNARDAGHGKPKSSRLLFTQGTWTMSVPTSKPAIDSRQRHPDVPDELSEFFKRTRLQKFEADIREQFGVVAVEELRTITVLQLKEIGFQKLQVEKIGKELARLEQYLESKKRRKEQAEAEIVPATMDGVASALSNLRSSDDFTQPLETMRLQREEEQWDEFAELLLSDSQDVTLHVTRFGDESWTDDPSTAGERAVEREAAAAAAKANARTWGDASTANHTLGDPEKGQGEEEEEEAAAAEGQGEASDTVAPLVTASKKRAAPLRRSPSGMRGTSDEKVEITGRTKGPRKLS